MRTVKRDEKRYYEELVEFSKKNLMIFPYHLSDVVIKGLRYTFQGIYDKFMHH